MDPQDTIKTTSRRNLNAGDRPIRHLPPTLIEGVKPCRLECTVVHSVTLEIRHADGRPFVRFDTGAKLTVVPEGGSLEARRLAANDHFVEHPLHRP
jgi:hypothetical protein